MDKISFKEIAHLYVGVSGYKKNSTVTNKTPERLTFRLIDWIRAQGCQNFIPILRSLDDMTMDELKEYTTAKEGFEPTETDWKELHDEIKEGGASLFNFDDMSIFEVAASMKYLLSKGFDLFNLIENNFAIKQTK